MRAITIDGEKWKYNVGKDVTVLRRPDHTIFGKVTNWALIGVDPSTFERGKYKRTSDGMVKPSHIAAFIKAELEMYPNAARRRGHGNPLLDEKLNPNAGYVTPAPKRKERKHGTQRRGRRH